MSYPGKCKWCEQEAKTSSQGDVLHYNCRQCGKYSMEFSLFDFHIEPSLFPCLSAEARQASEARQPAHFTRDNFSELAARHQSVSISSKVDKVLRLIAARCEFPGKFTRVDWNTDFPLVDCIHASEAQEYVNYLVEQRLLNRPVQANLQEKVRPTVGGWQLLEPTLTVGGDPSLCFVAMSFADSLDDAYRDGFAKAIDDCGFKPYRQKEDPTNKAIVDRIFSEIRRSGFMVADFTSHRTSVYYEAGFASELGREIISCCHVDHVKDLTFDTRHLGHVVWNDASDLREKLRNSIQANIIPKR